MGYYNEQIIANCDARTSDDDIYDRIDYGRTNNLNSARENVKNELNLKARWSDTHVAQRYADFCAAKEALQQQWKARLLANDEEGAEAVRAEAVALCKSYYGVED